MKKLLTTLISSSLVFSLQVSASDEAKKAGEEKEEATPADDKKVKKAKKAKNGKKPKNTTRGYGAFDVIDKESNGSINEIEFLRKFANAKKGATEAQQNVMKENFKKLDADKDGKLSKEEYGKIAEVMKPPKK